MWRHLVACASNNLSWLHPSRQLTVHWQPTMLKFHKESDFHLPQSQNCLLGSCVSVTCHECNWPLGSGGTNTYRSGIDLSWVQMHLDLKGHMMQQMTSFLSSLDVIQQLRSVTSFCWVHLHLKITWCNSHVMHGVGQPQFDARLCATWRQLPGTSCVTFSACCLRHTGFPEVFDLGNSPLAGNCCQDASKMIFCVC